MFHQWWRPQLSCAGYDSVYKKRTDRSGVHREGAVIAWKRDLFQLFRSEELEFNRLCEDEENEALAAKVAVCDNVAVMVLLQPWQDSTHPSGACVACTQLHEEHSSLGDDIRVLQAQGLTRTVEAFNSDFQLPTILCGTMNCLPSSACYAILCQGIRPRDPSVPGHSGKPTVEPLSTSSALVRWSPPEDDSEAPSPLVDRYKVLWVPGGSRFLEGEWASVMEGDCLVYDRVENENGTVRTVPNPLRSFVVTGLSSGVAYEFQVSAANAIGEGPWGERSEPVRMPLMPGNDPEDRNLLSCASIHLLRQHELSEIMKQVARKNADLRAYNLRKLIKVDGLIDLGIEEKNSFASVSGLTPRFSDGTIHPDIANCRTGTEYILFESQMDEKIRQEMAVEEEGSGRRCTRYGGLVVSSERGVGSGGDGVLVILKKNTRKNTGGTGREKHDPVGRGKELENFTKEKS
ncbi:unnamed protein product [Choristocarpus tenellus]